MWDLLKLLCIESLQIWAEETKLQAKLSPVEHQN